MADMHNEPPIDQVLDELEAKQDSRSATCSRQLAEIKDWLWPNQTGMPNEHRNALVAIKMKEKLLKQRIAELESENREVGHPRNEG